MKIRAVSILIELLVVIAVIAALMSVLMPALNKARTVAQWAKCQGNIETDTLAVAMYVENHNGRYSDPGRCYFSQRDQYPVESRAGGNHLHLRWCNGDLNLKDNPEYGGQMVPGSDTTLEGWFGQSQNNPWLVEPGPQDNGGLGGAGPFRDVVADFHNAPSGDPLSVKGNYAFLDGHVGAVSRLRIFFYSWPNRQEAPKTRSQQISIQPLYKQN